MKTIEVLVQTDGALKIDAVGFTGPGCEKPTRFWRRRLARPRAKPRSRDRGHYDTLALAKASEGHTGAEIEQAFIDALYAAFAAGREPTMPDIQKALAETVPLSKLMAEQIAGLKKWSQGRCRMATSPVKVEQGRRIAA